MSTFWCAAHRQVLILSSNSFSLLPQSTFRIHCLKRLSVNQNGLESLPDEVGQLEHLEYLSACNNSLSDLPLGITELHNLKQLWLDWNGIEARAVCNYYCYLCKCTAHCPH